MKFLEKTLEDIIYNNFRAVGQRGLDLFEYSESYYSVSRQVQLGAYGVADLIAIEWFRNPCTREREVIITIIECKLATIDINAFLQAKRYKTAVRAMLREFNLTNTAVTIKTVLIGSELSLKGDFVFALNDDDNCECFTYTYDFDGILFAKCGRGWRKESENLPTDTLKTTFLKGFKRYRQECLEKLKPTIKEFA